MIQPRSTALALFVAVGLSQLASAEVVTPTNTPEGHAYHHIPLPGAPYNALILAWPNDAASSVPGKEGLALLGGKLLLEKAGGRTFDELTEALKDESQSIRVENAVDATFVTLLATAESEDGFALAAAIAADAIHRPVFDPDDLSRIQADIADNLAETERNPVFMAQRAFGAFSVGHDRRLSLLTNRPVETVTGVTVEDLQRWREEAFRQAPVIVAAGAAQPGAFEAAIDTVIEAKGLPPEIPLAVPPVTFENLGQAVSVEAPELDQAFIMYASPVDDSSAAIVLLQTALSGGPESILFRQVREGIGAAYQIQAGGIPILGDQKVLTVVTAVPPERAGEVSDVVHATFERMSGEGLTEGEFRSAREQVRATLDKVADDPQSAAGMLVAELLAGRTANRRRVLDELDTMTLESFNASLAQLLSEPPTTITVTPEPETVAASCTVSVPEDAAACD